MPDRVCTRCAAIIPTGTTRCPNCAATPRLTGHARQRRNAAVLRRDGYVCQLRIVCDGAPATCVDHTIPLSDQGSNAMSNLRASCADCNQLKGDRP